MDEYYKNINFSWFDYIKLGHYDENLGGLNKESTNQKLYHLIQTKFDENTHKIEFKDITNLFWKKG
jgi:hypothetical protein